MGTAWITYAWDDNKDHDVDFVAQELESLGVTIKLDRWNIGAGRRLWEQIDQFITNPAQSDAWLLYATQNSLGSEPCKEEFAYALDRALKTRGAGFPVIAVFPGSVANDLIPSGIRTRLYVSLTDPDWKERVKAAVEGKLPLIEKPTVLPYTISVTKAPNNPAGEEGCYIIEVRPRAGVWCPFFVAIPQGEKDRVDFGMIRGPRGNMPSGGVAHMVSEGPSDDCMWWLRSQGDEATPTQSYFITCKTLPSELVFGVAGGNPQFRVQFTPGDLGGSVLHVGAS